MRVLAAGILSVILLAGASFGAFVAYERDVTPDESASLEQRGDTLAEILGEDPSMAEMQAGIVGVCASLIADEHEQAEACMVELASVDAQLSDLDSRIDNALSGALDAIESLRQVK